jgi:uncharacterized coiled-coil protein SlyX
MNKPVVLTIGALLAAAVGVGWGVREHAQAEQWQAQALQWQAQAQNEKTTLEKVKAQLAQVQRGLSRAQTQLAQGTAAAQQSQPSTAAPQSAETPTNAEETAIRQTVQAVFEAIFNYDNKTYDSRFQKVQAYMTQNVHDAFQGTKAPESSAQLQAQIQSTVKHVGVGVWDITSASASAFVALTVQDTINHNTMSPATVYYLLSLKQQEGRWVITDAVPMQPYYE